MLGGEHLRLTYIPYAEWAAGATVRIQKRMASGQLANGPEVPERLVSQLAKGLVDLTCRTTRHRYKHARRGSSF